MAIYDVLEKELLEAKRHEKESWEKEQLELNKSGLPSGKFLEIHSLKGRPSVAIYMQGFVDSSFKAILKEGETQKLLFRSLAVMNFETLTNVIARDYKAKSFAPETMGTFDVFWAKESPRFAIAYRGNFVASYDCKTGQKIQIRDGLDTREQCRALGKAMESFLDGKEYTDADVEEIRKNSYPKQSNP